jgi:hypothetical protein
MARLPLFVKPWKDSALFRTGLSRACGIDMMARYVSPIEAEKNGLPGDVRSFPWRFCWLLPPRRCHTTCLGWRAIGRG